jgi:hypothetical protein
LIAIHSFMHEHLGVEAAVTDTMRTFGVSRASVFDARRRMHELNKILDGSKKSN